MRAIQDNQKVLTIPSSFAEGKFPLIVRNCFRLLVDRPLLVFFLYFYSMSSWGNGSEPKIVSTERAGDMLELVVSTPTSGSTLFIQQSPRIVDPVWSAVNGVAFSEIAERLFSGQLHVSDVDMSFFRIESISDPGCELDLVPEIALIALPSEMNSKQKIDGTLSVILNNFGTSTLAAGEIVGVQISALHLPSNATTLIDFATTEMTRDLRPGGARSLEMDFSLPSEFPSGDFRLLVSIDPANVLCERDRSNNMVEDSEIRTVTGGHVDLYLAINNTDLSSSLRAGDSGSINVAIGNLGSLDAAGTVEIDAFASLDDNLGPEDLHLGGATNSEFELPAFKETRFDLSIEFPIDTFPEDYRLFVRLVPTVMPGDENPYNDIAMAQNAYQIRQEFSLEEFRQYDVVGNSWIYDNYSYITVTNVGEVITRSDAFLIDMYVEGFSGEPTGTTSVVSREGGKLVATQRWQTDDEGTHSLGETSVRDSGEFRFSGERLNVAPKTFDPTSQSVFRDIATTIGTIESTQLMTTFAFEGDSQSSMRLFGYEDITLQSGGFYPKALKLEFSTSISGTLYFVIDGQRSVFGDFTQNLVSTTWAANGIGIVKSSSTLAMVFGGVQSLEQFSTIELARQNPEVIAISDAPDFMWHSGGSRPWRGDTEAARTGDFALRSGPVLDDQRSVLEARIEQSGMVTFWWKVSSEEEYDFLTFNLNGGTMNQISGETDWQQVSARILPGRNVLQWVYKKDLYGSFGDDTGWIDDIDFEPDTGPPSFLTQPTNKISSPGDGVTMSAVVIGTWPIEFQWQKNGVDVDGATNATLSIPSVQLGDTGIYRLVASNELGILESQSITLEVITEVSLEQALDQPDWSWFTGSTAWEGVVDVTHDGVDAAKSTFGGPERRSFLDTIVDGPGTLHFWWKLEANEPTALLWLMVDREVQFELSGHHDWAFVSIPIGEGSHEIRWIMWTDYDASEATNTAWVDDVQFME